MKKIASLLHNDFEYSLLKKYPELEEIKSRLIDCGALNSLVSGSGSAVFALAEEDSVEKIAGKMRAYCDNVYIARSVQ